MYGLINVQVIPLTVVLYAVGVGYFGLWARKRLQQAAPEELTARRAQLAQEGARPTDPSPAESPRRDGPRYPLLERTTAVVCLLVLLALAWVALAAWRPECGQWLALPVQVGIVLALLTAALALVSLVALLHTRA
jgi:hypothetical protein